MLLFLQYLSVSIDFSVDLPIAVYRRPVGKKTTYIIYAPLFMFNYIDHNTVFLCYLLVQECMLLFMKMILVSEPVKTVSPIDESDLSKLYDDFYDRLDCVDNKKDKRCNTQMHEVNLSSQSRNSANGSRDHESFFRTVIVCAIFILIR